MFDGVVDRMRRGSFRCTTVGQGNGSPQQVQELRLLLYVSVCSAPMSRLRLVRAARNIWGRVPDVEFDSCLTDVSL